MGSRRGIALTKSSWRQQRREESWTEHNPKNNWSRRGKERQHTHPPEDNGEEKKPEPSTSEADREKNEHWNPSFSPLFLDPFGTSLGACVYPQWPRAPHSPGRPGRRKLLPANPPEERASSSLKGPRWRCPWEPSVTRSGPGPSSPWGGWKGENCFQLIPPVSGRPYFTLPPGKLSPWLTRYGRHPEEPRLIRLFSLTWIDQSYLTVITTDLTGQGVSMRPPQVH